MHGKSMNVHRNENDNSEKGKMEYHSCFRIRYYIYTYTIYISTVIFCIPSPFCNLGGSADYNGQPEGGQ